MKTWDSLKHSAAALDQGQAVIIPTSTILAKTRTVVAQLLKGPICQTNSSIISSAILETKLSILSNSKLARAASLICRKNPQISTSKRPFSKKLGLKCSTGKKTRQCNPIAKMSTRWWMRKTHLQDSDTLHTYHTKNTELKWVVYP